MDYTIRAAEIRDAAGIAALRRTRSVYENTLALPSEHTSKTESFLAGASRNEHQFVAVTMKDGNEVVIGMAGLFAEDRPRTRHCGGIGIMVHGDYQNMGVGTALMRTLLDLADNWLMLIRVELTVFEHNERAIHLYEKFGFEKEGLKRFACARDGRYANEYLMARINFPKGFEVRYDGKEE